MAVISGLAPVDPFIMGLTQTAGKLTSMGAGRCGSCRSRRPAIISPRRLSRLRSPIARTGRQSLILMLGLTALGLVPLFWIAR